MSSNVAAYRRAPLEYRYALDAATTLLPSREVQIICNQPELDTEVRLRFAGAAAAHTAPGMLWVEPLARTWRAQLRGIADALATGAVLVVIASQPLAKLLPERRGWSAHPLCIRPGGSWSLHRALLGAGFLRTRAYGMHGLQASAYGLLGRLAQRGGRPELADRLEFRSRLTYRADGYSAWLSTVTLAMYMKGFIA